ncbi:hypothetical protein F5877DRAFT_72058 [Lentinula edodes]|nr:hypothetical protein F5877DRAFT_72058 [Lentinula edodes]
MFRNVCWPKDRSQFLPSSLWPYIKKLEFIYKSDYKQPLWVSQSRHGPAMKLLSAALPHIPNLATFVYSPDFPPNFDLIDALASTPSLHTLHIPTSFLVHDALTVFNSFHGVHDLVIEQVGKATLYDAPESKRLLSVQCVANIIQGCSETLESLEIPGEYCPLPNLLQRISLPVIRNFLLTGFPPLDSDSQNYPLWTVVQSMQKLKVLEVHCRLRVIGASPHRYELLPPNAAQDQSNLFSSRIESITISNPSFSDQIFKFLPHSLRSLVLDFIPDSWENMLLSGNDTMLAYHKPEMISSSASKWAGLRALELQGIRYFNRAEEPESDMAGIVAVLEQLEFLHTLKLAVEFKEDSYREGLRQERKIGSVDEAMQHWANIFRKRIKSLRDLAFEKRRHTGKGYGRRAAIGAPLWVWFS